MNPYIPDRLPITNLDYQLLVGLVGNANAELARYDGLLQGIPNPAVMLSPLTTKEAVLSSKIEGTQATVDEVLEQEAGLIKEGEKYKDIQEISKYRLALFQASEHLRDYPIRLGLSVSLRINQSYIFKSCIFSILGCYFVPPNFDNTIYHNIVDI